MTLKMKAALATVTDTSESADEFPGTFEVELSNETTDRDGDTLTADGWELPLPEQITFVNDHTHKMASVVGSAKPELVGGKILCKGTWAPDPESQVTRSKIGHVPYVSVAYHEKASGKRELINGSFVVVPSNPSARVLASKSVDELDDTTPVSELTLKQFRELSGPAEIPAIFDALGDHELEIVIDEKASTVAIKQHGNLLGEHKFSTKAPEAPVKTADQSADPELEKKAAAQALAAANQIIARPTELEG